jgi:hypothetical protein
MGGFPEYEWELVLLDPIWHALLANVRDRLVEGIEVAVPIIALRP